MSKTFQDSEEFAPAEAMKLARAATHGAQAMPHGADSQEFLATDVARAISHVPQALPQVARAATGPGASAAIPAVVGAVSGAIGPIADTTPGPTTTAANVIGYAGMVPLPLMFGPFLVNSVPKGFGHAVGWVGEKTGWKGLEDFGAKRAHNANRRSQAFERWSDTKMSGRFKEIEKSRVLSAVERPFVGAVHGIDHLTGLSGKRIERLEKARTNALGKLADPITHFDTYLGRCASSLGAEEVGRIRTHFDAFKQAAAGNDITALNEARTSLAHAVGDVHKLHRKTSPNPFEEATAESLGKANIFRRGWRAAFGMPDKAPKDAKAAVTGLKKEFKLLNHQAHNASTAVTKAKFWDGVGNRMTHGSLGRRIGEMGTMHVALNAGFLASNIAMNLHSLHSFRSQLHQFEAIYQGITGKECSTWTALMGDVPPVLKHAQKQLLRGAISETGINAAITGLDSALFFVKHGGVAMVVAQGLGSQVRDSFACEVPLVQIEQAMAAAQKKGQRLEPGHYAQLLQAAAPETIGRVKTTNSMFVRLCNQLATEQWSALKTLQAVNDHSLDDLAAKIQQDMAARGRQSRETVPAQPQAVEIPAPANVNSAVANQNKPQMRIQPASAVHVAPSQAASMRIG